MITLAAIYAVISLITTGFSQAFMKGPSEVFSTSKNIAYRNGIISLIALGFIPLFRDTVNFDVKYILLGALIATASYMGLFFYIKAIKHGKVGLVSPVASSSLVFSVLVGVIFLGDYLTVSRAIAIIAVLFGVTLLSINFKSFKNSGLFDKATGIPYAILAALVWGLTIPFFSIPSEKLGPLLFTLVLEGTILVISLITLHIKTEPLKLLGREKSKFPTLVLASILAFVGSFFQNYAYSTQQIIVTVTIISATPLVSIWAGKILHSDRLTKLQYLGAVLAVSGGILAAVF